MDKNRWKKISQILDDAITYPDEKRNTYIKRACGDDTALLNEVKELLASMEKFYGNDDNLEEELEKNEALFHLAMSDVKPDEDVYLAGNTIGPWNITELIGRGGMGSVYKAQRKNEAGIQQSGALKIIHKSLITPSHTERFRLEQQILSGLQHPNIAGFIDSGITSDGIPYMVMEYVEGVSLLEYCDKNKLPVSKRLELFKTVCRTIQFAHKSLIVHRDLKAENILVTGEGHVKILDFGIAKLLDPNLYELSPVETQPGLRMLSLEYASPEQVAGKPVTTSTDVYSLGVLLYRLLTGVHPFEVDDHSFREVEKMVLKKDSPLPSHRFSNLQDGNRKKEIARNRNLDPSELTHLLKGDLDAIANKALQKNPERRYDSAEVFTTDIERHQQGLPISARPDTLGYRSAKFISRHRWAVTAAVLVILSLGVGIVATLWQAKQAEQNAEQAEQVSAFLLELIEGSDPTKSNEGSTTVRELLDQGYKKFRTELNDQPIVRARMLGMIGKVYDNLGLYDEALPALEESIEGFQQENDQSSDYATALLQYANLQYRLGDSDKMESAAREAYQVNLHHFDEDAPQNASILNTLAIALQDKGEKEEATQIYRQIINIRRNDPEQQSNLAINLNNLAILLQESGELDESEELYKEAIQVVKKKWGEEHPYMAYVLNGYAGIHEDRKDFKKAIDALTQALTIGRAVFPEEHPFIAVVLHNIGRDYEYAEDYETAVDYYRKALDLRRKSLPSDHIDIASSLDALGWVAIKTGQPTEAEPMLRQALDIRKQTYQENDWRVAQVESHLGRSLRQQGKIKEAKTLLEKSYPVLEDFFGPDHFHVQRTQEDLNEIYQQAGNPVPAQ
ncbi:serine/threonine-protein kinase [Rhodohalobacter sp. 614A]|uniref:serine/threonine-protein kinase n=1 Tax=Rhodohalobacter sp. 614A TaxID=2908649 RepID=UPI001F1E6AEE|nr:serine/threonine-protein kinase [Rhodohalobacter sp. 614A]